MSQTGEGRNHPVGHGIAVKKEHEEHLKVIEEEAKKLASKPSEALKKLSKKFE